MPVACIAALVQLVFAILAFFTSCGDVRASATVACGSARSAAPDGGKHHSAAAARATAATV